MHHLATWTRTALGMLTLAGLMLAAAAASADDTKTNTAVTPSAREATMKRHEKFLERAKKGPVDLLFLGDSITQGWEGNGKDVWKNHYENLNAANFGISGDRTQHVLWRITEGRELKDIHPKVVVLMIGTNNMGASQPTKEGQLGTMGNSTAEIIDGVTAIVKEIHKQLPRAKVLLLAIFPRGEKAGSPVRAKIDEVNRALAKLDDKGKTVHYLDIGAKFLEKDGTLNPEIMKDYLHLTEKGYVIWAAAIAAPLKKLME